LFIQSIAALFHLLRQVCLEAGSVLLELAELLNQTIRREGIHILAVICQSHLAHQGRTLMMEGNGDGRLIEKEG
jgi:hypothetical protein